MDYDDEVIKMMIISTHCETLTQEQLKNIYQEEILIETSVIVPVHFQDKVAENVLEINPADHGGINASMDLASTDQQANPLTNGYQATTPQVVTSAIPNPLDILKEALQTKGLEALKQHFQKLRSLYLTNTGGQMEFQEVCLCWCLILLCFFSLFDLIEISMNIIQ